jgi:hypothetical protein
MKTVFTNHMVAHVFAQQQQQNGTSSNGAFSFFGSELKSYNTVIGKFVKPDLLLVNSYSYSVTTSNHISLLRNAISGNVTVLECPNINIKLGTKHGYTEKQNKIAHTENLSYFKNETKKAILKASRARTMKDYYNNQALNFVDTYNKYLSLFKLRLKLFVLPNFEQIKLDDLKFAKSKIRKNKAIAKKRIKDNQEKITNWLAGELVSVPYDIDCMIRLRGDTIETSQGAQFPAAHGYIALSFIKSQRKKSESWKSNGHTIKLGHFAIDEIDQFGNVKAGCHNVKYAQIIRIERELLTWRANSKNKVQL